MSPANPVLSGRLSLVFSSVGHTFSHLLTLLYPTVVLVLQDVWQLPYGELLALAIAGQVLFGVGALPSGWLGDRWSATGMIVVFFLGTGGAAVATGFADTPVQLALGLAAIGLFASIYHPVGIAWLVRTSVNRGKALGINGVFGSIGLGAAALVAGGLSDWLSWRAAFIVPGLVCVGFGAAMALCLLRGWLVDQKIDAKPAPTAGRSDMVRAFWVLSLTMLLGGLINQTCTVALPKLFDETLSGLVGGGTAGVGAMVSGVFVFTALAQLFGGALADRVPLKLVYIASFALQVPMLALVLSSGGFALYGSVVIAMVMQVGALPTENSLLARYTPEKWRATAFGAKFVLSLGVAAAGLPLVALVYEKMNSVVPLFGLLAVFAAIVAVAGLLLPRDQADNKLAAQPATAGGDD